MLLCHRSTFLSYSKLVVESRQSTPPVYGTSVGGWPRLSCWDIRHQKSRVPWLSCGVVCMILYRTPLTDRHTTTAYTALAWRRVVKTIRVFWLLWCQFVLLSWNDKPSHWRFDWCWWLSISEGGTSPVKTLKQFCQLIHPIVENGYTCTRTRTRSFTTSICWLYVW